MIDYPKVSVVTITYGHEQYITQTLDGVLMQNYPGEIEFIIANDNSPDNTDKVVKDYFLQTTVPCNFTIKYTKHDLNKGVMPNFMWALEQAFGEYIALCEGDDYWIDPDKLQKQLDLLGNNKWVSLSFHNRKICDKNRIIYSALLGEEDKVIKNNKLLCYAPTQTMVFRNYKDFLKLNMEDVFSGDYFLKAFLSTKGDFYFHAFEGAVYREHEGGVATSKSIVDKTDVFISSRMRVLERISGVNKQELYQSIFNQQTNLLIHHLQYRHNISKLLQSMLKNAILSRNLLNFKIIVLILTKIIR